MCGLQSIDCLFTVSTGLNVNSNDENANEFPGQVEGSASHDHKLYVCTAMTGDQSSVVTPDVVNAGAHTTPSDFTCETMAPFGPECC